MNHPLVSSEWLHQNSQNSNVVILDASSKSNQAGLSAKHASRVIKGAHFFDLKNIFSDQYSSFPNSFPSEKQFEDGCRDIGINSTSIIVVYDNLGIYTSPRVWWMFKAMGHEQVHVLDGGLPGWIDKGFETNTYYDHVSAKGDFKAKMNSNRLVDFDFIRGNEKAAKHTVIDARSSDRFRSKVPEPREGLRSGNIPGSINIPYTEVLAEGFYKSSDKLATLFQDKQLEKRPLTFSCGSGITACIVLLAAELVGKGETSVYDGSWTEYATLTQQKS